MIAKSKLQVNLAELENLFNLPNGIEISDVSFDKDTGRIEFDLASATPVKGLTLYQERFNADYRKLTLTKIKALSLEEDKS